ncbi:glycerate kinase [Blastococcus sp. KM273128]|uniref:glycerate kinase n=1 Tax=Blastococcus sp. KM273128 TaxID=2570314 RepID=UPI001F3333B3|nr:glycerate kinase [Blastococcus sp. KM273128]
MHVLIAPDSFKGSLDADRAAEAIADGLRRTRPDAEVVLRPVADGGEGTVAAALRAGYRARTARVTGPDGRPVDAVFALDGTTAVLELASAAGLGQLAEPAPLTATTYGVGELVRAALDAGARRIVLGAGGSATTDGGAGLLQALGVRLLDADGGDVPPGGAGLARLDRIDMGSRDPRLQEVELVVGVDVDNPLTGPEGAAAVFGPQKGATPEDVAVLDAALGRFAAVVQRDLVADVARPRADALVVTGEGSLDEQTLRGKAPAEVVARASAAGVPCLGLAGVVRLSPERLRAAGFVAGHGLTEVEPDVARCLAEAPRVLAELAGRVISTHLPPGPPR